jgi:hypothetical protein
MIRALFMTIAFASLTTPSLAGVNLMCSDGDRVTADFPLAGGEGLSLLGATISVGDGTWSTDRDIKHAIQLAPHQSARVNDRISIDLADANSERIVARLRLFQVLGYEEIIIGGTLEIIDVGAWVVTCDVG